MQQSNSNCEPHIELDKISSNGDSGTESEVSLGNSPGEDTPKLQVFGMCHLLILDKSSYQYFTLIFSSCID